jgi:hypothetical protein
VDRKKPRLSLPSPSLLYSSTCSFSFFASVARVWLFVPRRHAWGYIGARATRATDGSRFPNRRTLAGVGTDRESGVPVIRIGSLALHDGLTVGGPQLVAPFFQGLG